MNKRKRETEQSQYAVNLQIVLSEIRHLISVLNIFKKINKTENFNRILKIVQENFKPKNYNVQN